MNFGEQFFMKKRRNIKRSIGLTISALIILLAVAHIISTPILTKKLERKISEIKAQGDPVTLQDLGKTDIPDSENAAVVYMQIFEAMERPIEYEKGVPVEKCKRNAEPGWLKLCMAKTDDKRTPQMWEEARKSLASYQKVYALVDKATSMPDCRFKTNWGSDPNTQHPYYSIIRELVRLLYTTAIIDARDGNMDSAVRNASRIFEISKNIKNEPVLVGQLLRYAIIAIGVRSVNEISKHGFTNNQIDMLEKSLADTSVYDGYLIALKGERAFAITTIGMLLGDTSFDEDENNKPPSITAVATYIIKPIVCANTLTYLQAISSEMKDAGVPVMYREKSYVEIAPGKPLSLRPSTILSKMLLALNPRARQQRDLCEARRLSCQTMLSIVKYQHKFGIYPDTLKDLRSNLKIDIPVDPMSGKDFHYKRQDKGFTLYSVGKNMRDDAGLTSKGRYASKGQPDDITWNIRQ